MNTPYSTGIIVFWPDEYKVWDNCAASASTRVPIILLHVQIPYRPPDHIILRRPQDQIVQFPCLLEPLTRRPQKRKAPPLAADNRVRQPDQRPNVQPVIGAVRAWVVCFVGK